MTTGYLYLGPESVAWIDTDNQLLAKSESSSMPGLSDKLDYLQSYLVQNPDSSIHLIVGSSLEEVRSRPGPLACQAGILCHQAT